MYLTKKQTLVTIIISYFIFSYINKTFNPFELTLESRFVQVLITGASLLIQSIIRIK